MKISINKWLAYTFLVGLIPVLARLLVWLIAMPGIVSPLVSADFVAFGLILHISVINEIEHLHSKDDGWKTIQNGTSLIFVTLYGALYTATIISEKGMALIDSSALLRSSIVLSIVSSILSLTVFHRLSRLGK